MCRSCVFLPCPSVVLSFALSPPPGVGHSESSSSGNDDDSSESDDEDAAEKSSSSSSGSSGGGGVAPLRINCLGQKTLKGALDARRGQSENATPTLTSGYPIGNGNSVIPALRRRICPTQTYRNNHHPRHHEDRRTSSRRCDRLCLRLVVKMY